MTQPSKRVDSGLRFYTAPKSATKVRKQHVKRRFAACETKAGTALPAIKHVDDDDEVDVLEDPLVRADAPCAVLQFSRVRKTHPPRDCGL